VSKISNFWKTLLAGGAGVAALAALNAAIQRGAIEPDDSALGGSANFFPWKHGRIFFKEAGELNGGRPLVFIHGVGPGASSFMWRKNFDALADHFHVYALDLLGFGFSDKPANAHYSPELYIELISDFLRDVIGRDANVIASSLGSSYAVLAANEHPELINSLILNSPTGHNSTNSRPGMAGAAFYGLLQSPVLGTSFYNVMASERSIRDYAHRELFYDYRRVSDRLVAHVYSTSHQPGAQFVIAAFLSGYLNVDMTTAFRDLQQPILLVWGKQDLNNPVSRANTLLNLNPNARLEVFDFCRMMPEQEHPERFNELVRDSFRLKALSA
jgi:pimeloyl-ACP methyl ester carboxylesterase